MINNDLTIIIDHGQFAGYNSLRSLTMEEIAISKFKATCLAVLERVRRTKQPIRVTRFGKPVAEIVPSADADKPRRPLGTLGGTIDIQADIVGPIGDESDWEAAQENPPWDPFPKDTKEKK
jgi:prevent-host-death family protein